MPCDVGTFGTHITKVSLYTNHVSRTHLYTLLIQFATFEFLHTKVSSCKKEFKGHELWVGDGEPRDKVCTIGHPPKVLSHPVYPLPIWVMWPSLFEGPPCSKGASSAVVCCIEVSSCASVVEFLPRITSISPHAWH